MYSTDFLMQRVALVTGGAGGIGKAVARALASSGATVVAADLKVPEAASQGGIEHVALDVTQGGQIKACVDDIVSRHGRLDILVNVAGVVSLGNVADLAEQEWDRVMNINLKINRHGCRRRHFAGWPWRAGRLPGPPHQGRRSL